jgi:DNA-binding NarL/FixJ family response regulator
MGAPRILVVDDQDVVRKRICATLRSRADYDVCAEAVNGKEAIEKALALHPDVIVLDITMPIVNGLEAARIIVKECPQTAILMLSVHCSRQVVEEAQRIGAQGYVPKTEAGKYLVAAIDAILRHEPFFWAEV